MGSNHFGVVKGALVDKDCDHGHCVGIWTGAVWTYLYVESEKEAHELRDILLNRVSHIQLTDHDRFYSDPTRYPQWKSSTLRWRNVSVSHDTMRPEDLIPEFLYVLQQLNRGKYILMKDHPEDWDSEECSDYLAELFDVLDQEAPVGFYFGARMGDGSDYGFWEAEEI